jgi:hypothetical protein
MRRVLSRVSAEPVRFCQPTRRKPSGCLPGRFSRRIRGRATAQGVPRIDGRAGERKHHLAEEPRKTTPITRGVFLILAGKCQLRFGK